MTFSVGNAGEHRLLLTSLLQRSRYYLANRARVNEAEIIEGKQEISSRFYEGVEAGAVLLGEPPRPVDPVVAQRRVVHGCTPFSTPWAPGRPRRCSRARNGCARSPPSPSKRAATLPDRARSAEARANLIA